MITKIEPIMKNPSGVDIQVALLQEFESVLDPLNRKSKIHAMSWVWRSAPCSRSGRGFKPGVSDACAPSGREE
jgi:hypothetical protein